MKLIIAIITPFALLGADCRLSAPPLPSATYDPQFVAIGSPSCVRCGAYAQQCIDQGLLPVSFGFSEDGRTCNMRCEQGVHFTPAMNGTPGEQCGYEMNLRGSTVQDLCPLDHYQGDAEFDGHGPEITVTVLQSVSGNQVLADIGFDAEETSPDRTAVRGQFSRQVASHGDSRVQIDRILSDGRYFTRQTTTGTGPHDLVDAEDDHVVLVDLVVVGDTGGTDIAGDANRCEDEAHIEQLSFRPVRVRMVPAP